MNRRHTAIGVTVFALLVVGIVFVSVRKSPKAPSGTTHISFRLDWTPGAEHSFLYLAKEKGYFRDENLDVEVQAGDGSTTSAKLVGNGSIDYALCSGDTALIAASAGAPVRVLAVLYSRTPAVVYSRKDRNITNPKDLEGHTYSAYMKSTTYNQFLAFCAVAHVDLSKIKIIATAGKAEDILTDAVDASGGYTYIQPIQCELAGFPVSEIPMADFGVNSYSMSIIANREKMQAEVTRRLVRALLRSFDAMLSDNTAALEAYLRANPTANKDFETKKLKKLTEFVKTNLQTQRRTGAQTLEGWQQTQEFLVAQKLIDKRIDLSAFFTVDFLPQQ
jgi:NitT/TauT family transport system substrate-binding protein